MDTCRRPVVIYPSRVPIKVIGKEGVLSPERIMELIPQHLGPQPEADRTWSANRKGAYISYTFWATLPDENAEKPLREAIHSLPGFVMQL